MLTAEEARSMAEDEALVPQETWKMVEDRTKLAIEKGNRSSSLSFNKNCVGARPAWPLCKKLKEYGYTASVVDTAVTYLVTWSW